MKPFFSCIVEIETLTPPRALTRLAKEGVSVYGAEKIGAGKLRICVKSKDLRKIFAIFPRSCYTIHVIKYLRLARAARFVKKRAVLCAAAAVFAVLCALSDLFVLRIRFQGSGSYYAEEALPILAGAGVSVFSPLSEEKASAAERALYALPSVSFCSVEKEGTVVTVTLEVNEEVPAPERESELVSPADGVVESVTVLRGTALVSEGDAVVRGQVLVSGRVAAGEEGCRDTYPVAWCALLCECVAEYESAEKSEEARERAVAKAALLAEGETVTANIFVSGDEGAYVYRVSLTYRRVCSAGV